MPSVIISGSTNVSVLDSLVRADLCGGNFYVDASPSIFIGAGASNVLGVKIRIINPAGVIIKDFGSSYDAAPGLSGGVVAPVSVQFPTKGGAYQYGVYTFSLQMTDANGVVLPLVTKTQNICAFPDEAASCSDAVQMVANCNAGRLDILMAEPFAYQGQLAQSRTQAWTVYYPTASGLSSLYSPVGNFSVQLFEGVYKVIGSLCAMYAMGDNIFVSIGYSGNWSKDVKCVLDYTCIFPQLERLMKFYKSACSDKEKLDSADTLLNVLGLLKTVEITLNAGEDASDYIEQLETALGCSCTGSCAGASPIINNTPSTNFSITGCNVFKDTIGLTDVYQIDNYQFIVAVDPTQSILRISAPALNNCIKTQTLTLDTAQLYAGFQSQINNNIQYSFYANVISQYLATVDPTSLGLSQDQWKALSLQGKIQAIIDFANGGGSCNSTVTGSVVKVGTDAVFTFAMVSGYYLEIYVDMVLRGTVLAGSTTFTVSDVADGQLHQYALIPRCVNGQRGTPFVGSFQYLACPDIEPPSVSSNNVNNAACPYDLTALVASLPSGITAEWHTANNTSASTLVGSPTAVSSGIYFVFAKDVHGCYSIGVQVQVICAADSGCSAPQNLTASVITGGQLVQFQGATFPPPANSYTVKRRLTSDPDVIGSYTTIGTPSFNSTSGKWELLDTNVIFPFSSYTYRAISNCSSSAPYVDYLFITGDCVTPTITHDATTINVSVGSYPYAHKIRVDRYDVSGTVLLETQYISTSNAFSRSITFLYLNSSTTYVIKTSIYQSSPLTYIKDCTSNSITTSPGVNISISNSIPGCTLTETSVSGSSYFTVSSGSLPLTNGQTITGIFSSFGGVIEMTTSGTYGPSRAGLYVNGALVSCIDISAGAGSYAFPTSFFSSGDQMIIMLVTGTSCP